LAIAGVSVAQFENGHVRILQDRRYQEGAKFGNFRNQEDGIKYQEETDANGIRRGFWEYPDEAGKIVRYEFEAGPGIGFRITNSNNIHASLIDNAARPAAPVVRQPVPAPRRAVPAARPVPVRRTVVRTQPDVVVAPRFARPVVTTTTPRGPINLFDYPANLDFSRHAHGHSFSFKAV